MRSDKKSKPNQRKRRGGCQSKQRVSNSLKRDCVEEALPQIIEKRAVYNTCEKPESATRPQLPQYGFGNKEM